MNSRYAEWLKAQGVTLFEGCGMQWRLYRGALVPAPAHPVFVALQNNEARDLLKKSRAWFIRYSSKPCDETTEWWYVICDTYNPNAFPSKIRNMIKRSYRDCCTERIDVAWLADHGYECYAEAFGRYMNAQPNDKKTFRNTILQTAEGPFEYWGVFVGKNLAGYGQCIVEEKDIATNTIKLHPSYLKFYASYSLITNMIIYYVTEKGMVMSNGSRSIAHDTNFQDFLIKLGFKKRFCHLNIVYQHSLKILIRMAFPFRNLLTRFSKIDQIHNMKSLLEQEDIRRKCNAY